MNTKKKILFLVTQSEFGGAQRFIYRLITNLDLTKYDISVAAGPEGNDANGLLFNLKKEDFRTIALKFLRRGVNPLFDLLGLFEIKRLIKKEQPDILFLCSTKAGILGSLAYQLNSKFKIKNSKLIYRIGGWTFNDPWPNWKRRLYLWLEKETAKFKDIIINNAESDRQQAIKLGIKPKNEIVTIHNGLDIDKLEFLFREEARFQISEILKLNQNSKLEIQNLIIGTIANFYSAKGLEYLIQAVNLTKDNNLKFILIGDGQEREKLEKAIKKYNLENKFFLVGAIPEAYKYLKAFDIFVLPSVKEGFPWTILEAMAAGVPVVATRVGAMPEIIQENKTGILIEPKNPQQIADAITKLLNNENLRKGLAEQGRKTVIEKFNLDKMIKEIEGLF
jgi:glycosyltransferase involved in cell wall biosynthesis